MAEPPRSETTRLQQRHRSIRRYTDQPIDAALLHAVIRAGQSAATSSFVQAYSIIRVTRPQARATIAQAAGDQTWVTTAAEFLVICADLRRIEAVSLQHRQDPLAGQTEHSLVAVIDAALMAQNLLLAAESLGLGGVFIGGIRNDPQRVAEQLKLPRLVAPLFGLCLGWPAQTVPVKPRLPTPVILHEDEYDYAAFTAAQPAYDRQMADYYAHRELNARTDDWSTASLRAIQNKKREHLLAFLQRQGFFRC